MRFSRPWHLPARVTILLALVTVVVAGSSAARGDAAASGLVAAYSFDAGTGSTAADASGNGNDGAISGASWNGAGKSGGALSFDGGDWVTVGDAPTLDLSDGMTLEAWVKPTGSGTAWRTALVKNRASGVAYALYAQQGSSRPATTVRVGTSKTTLGAAALPLDTWSHLAATYDGAALNVFVNGVPSGSTAVSGAIRSSSAPLVIGGGSGQRFVGLIDEVRVYSRALTATELQADMTAPVTPPQGDTTAPTAPSGLAVGGQTQSSVTLTWSPSSDNVGVTGYGRYRDGSLVASGTGTSYTFTGLACGTSYTLAVDAYDAAGNRSARPSVIAATSACTDTSPPTAPTALVAGGQTQNAITLTWGPSSDNVGVTGYGRYLSGALVGSGSATSYTFTNLTCGTEYTLAVDAYDGAGNRSTRSSLTASTSTCPTSSSLVAAYSFDAGSGSTAADLSGRGNNGTLFGPSWAPTGKSGGALSFDGVDDLVTVADAASLDLSTGMTLEAWVRPTTNASWRTVVTKEQAGNLVYGLFSNSDTTQPSSIVSIGSNPIQDIVRAPGALALSTWQHLATTYDGSTLRLYVDGVQVGTRTVSGAMPNSTGPLQIGGNRVWSEWFQGQIDDLRVYSRALSAAEIQNNMTTPVAPPPPPAPADTQAPSVPGGPAMGGGTQTSLTLSWAASSDNVGVAGYGYYRNGSLVGNGTGTSYTFGGLTCGSSYTLGVDAYDAAGNRSARSSVTGSTSACSSPAPPPSGLTVAPGQSWQAVYDGAPSGSVITVLAGSHGTQRIGGSKQVTFLGQSGAVMRQFWNEASNVTLDNVDIDGGGQQLTILEAHGANNVYRNLEVRNNTDRLMVMNAGTNSTYDNVFFHDAVITSAGEAADVHMECLWSNGPAIKVRNSTFKDCAIMDLLLTLGTWWGQQPYTGVVVEDNIFYPSERTNNQGTHYYGLYISDQLLIDGGWTIRRNRFDQPVGGGAAVSNATICGNTGAAPQSWTVPC
jgi:chitodextrinase